MAAHIRDHKFNVASKLQALEILCKYLGCLVEKVEVNGEETVRRVNTLVEGSLSTPITWVLNWTAELEQ